MPDKELGSAVADFLWSFELVFDNDWSHSEECLKAENLRDFIRPNCTFLRPGLREDNEGDNWTNRGSLLYAYRHLRRVAHSRGYIGPSRRPGIAAMMARIVGAPIGLISDLLCRANTWCRNIGWAVEFRQ